MDSLDMVGTAVDMTLNRLWAVIKIVISNDRAK